MLCELCHQNQAIRSHIIPKSISEWIKANSPTGGLIDLNNPNPRRQDTAKVPLLCRSCDEKSFSPRENRFKQEIFLPFNGKAKPGTRLSSKRKHDFNYSDWLLYFAISLSWRVAVTQGEYLQGQNPTLFSFLEEAIQSWSTYLLGQSLTNPYAHHLLLEGAFNSTQFLGAPYYDEAYALSTIDTCVPSTRDRVAIYIKIPGMFFFTGVHPANPTGWTNSLIVEAGTVSTSGQDTSDPLFWATLQSSSLRAAQAMNNRSPRQKGKTLERATRRRHAQNRKPQV